MKPVTSTMLAFCLLNMLTTTWAGPFDKGKTRFSITLGSGSAFGQNYTVFGAGIDYLVMDGVQLGFDVQQWSGAEPGITKLSPQLSYIFNRDGNLKPYGGLFYRKTSIDTLEDLESVGYRVGAYLSQGSGYQLAAGYVYEKYLDCQVSIFNDCEDGYPEFVLSFSL